MSEFRFLTSLGLVSVRELRFDIPLGMISGSVYMISLASEVSLCIRECSSIYIREFRLVS